MTKNSKVRLMAGTVIAALALVTIALGAVYAQQPAGDQPGMTMGRGMMGGQAFGGGRGLMALRMGLAQLNLTDQQKQQVKGIIQGHREQMQGFASQARQARTGLAQAVAAGADEPTIRARAAELGKVEADVAVFGAQLRKQVLEVLTPEQQAKAKELQQKAFSRMEQRMGGRGKK